MERLTPGVPSFFVDVVSWCFHCDAETLAAQLTKEFGFSIVGRGTGPQSVIMSETTLRIVRYQRSEWCAVVPASFYHGSKLFESEHLMARLSESLDIDALFLGIYDTAGGAKYCHFRCGQEIEALCIGDEQEQTQFTSRIRTVEKKEWCYDDVDDKVRELGIIPPMFSDPPKERIGSPLQAFTEFDIVADQIAEAIIVEKKQETCSGPES